jgi:DNA-directed RNA polymerase I, II, and III subunit RPABC1
MVRDRGYQTLRTFDNRERFNEFVAPDGIVRKEYMRFSCDNPTTGNTLIVMFATEQSIGVKAVVELEKQMAAVKMQHCILIYPVSVTPPAKKHIVKEKLDIELFSEDELTLNISRHKLMPKHQLLSSSEKTELLKISCLKDSQLPKILLTDPMARYLGAKRGNVIRIIRNSETAGKCVLYRLCA